MTLSISDTMDDPALFGPWFKSESWNGWRSVLKAAFALPLDATELAFFRSVAGDREPPAEPVKELWIIAGRRAGKDSIASLIGAHLAAFFDQGDRLRPGEKAGVIILACDKDQSRICLNYIRSFFRKIPMLEEMLIRETASGVELANSTEITVARNDFKAVRGRAALAIILDECAYYRDENSASPDKELYISLKPALATLPTSLMVGISSPYRRNGLLYDMWRKNYGKDGDVLVIRAPSLVLNPSLDRRIIEKAFEEDPAAAAAEWNAEFRSDIEAFITQEVVDAAIVPGRHELPPLHGVEYTAFVDPSGGSSDSMTMAIAHEEEGGRVVLDALRERKPPFSPDDVSAEFADLIKAYGLSSASSDRYAAEWPAERFFVHGIQLEPAEKSKSDLYRELLPLLNSGRIELLDHPRLASQLAGLERRTARGGRDSIDHAPGGHDDVGNAAAGALVNALTMQRVRYRELHFTAADTNTYNSDEAQHEAYRRLVLGANYQPLTADERRSAGRMREGNKFWSY